MIQKLVLYKFKFYIRVLKNPRKTALTLLLTLTAIIYGRLYGEISNYIEGGKIDFLTAEKFTTIVITAIAVMTLIRMVFPNYNPLMLLFPKYYPLSKAEIYFSSLINDFFKPYFFYILIFILSGSYYVEHGGFHFLSFGILTLLSSHLVRRSFQYIVDFQTKSSYRIFHGIGVLAIVCFIFTLITNSPYGALQIITLTTVLFVVGFFQESSILSRRFEEIKNKSSKVNIILKLLLNNKKARLPLLTGLFFKLPILLGDLFLFRIKGTHLLDGQIVFWLLASPLMIFTYVFNNAWGFWKNIWLNMELKVGHYKPLTSLIFRLILILIIVDLVLTVPILLISWSDYKFILLFYFTSAGYLLMLSFLWSLIFPRKISSIFQMKGSTSPWSAIASMGGVLLLTTMKINHWFYILIPLFFIIGGIGYWFSIDIYREKKYILFNKIMKE